MWVSHERKKMLKIHRLRHQTLFLLPLQCCRPLHRVGWAKLRVGSGVGIAVRVRTRDMFFKNRHLEARSQRRIRNVGTINTYIYICIYIHMSIYVPTQASFIAQHYLFCICSWNDVTSGHEISVAGIYFQTLTPNHVGWNTFLKAISSQQIIRRQRFLPHLQK